MVVAVENHVGILTPRSGVVALLVGCVCVALAGAGCRRNDGRDTGTVRIAIGGQNQLIYLPTTLARELGYYRDAGLEVELQDMAGGSKALEAMIGGSADVVSGFYDHTIQMAAEGRELVAFVTMLRIPGFVLARSPAAAATVTRIEDLKGKMIGVTTAGSSSHMILAYLLEQHGVPRDEVSWTPIGTAATAVAAIEHGKVAAGMMADPAFTLVSRRNAGVTVLADFRHVEGVKAALGTSTYPASVLYTSGDWLRAHRETIGKLASAITRTLAWMQSHTAQEIADKTPASFRGDDQTLYVDALKGSMAMYSPDGRMPAEGAEAVRKLLATSMDKVRNTTIDLSKTYTNEFIARDDH
jgi:NitT/TauT family transport system substrate-binding protein